MTPQQWLSRAMLALIMLTVILLLWHRFGMNTELRIDGDTPYLINAIDDRGMGGASVGSFITGDDGINLSCELKKVYQWPFCEISVLFAEAPDGIDFSQYDRISLDISTKGPGKRVRVYLRHFDPAYSALGDPSSYKINELRYTPNEATSPLILPLNAFQVASWWITEKQLPPQHVAPDLTNISFIEIATGDHVEEGLTQIHIRSIVLFGKLITEKTLFMVITSLWVAAAILYLVIYIAFTRRAIVAIQSREQAISQINIALELEKRELKELAHQDYLTNSYNRLGLRNHVYELTADARRNQTDLSIVFMDLDNFKNVNDEYGHDVGDKILITFADLVRQNTRGNDIFGRWGGEEFILLCPQTPQSRAYQVAEKIRACVMSQEWSEGLKITCSFGVAEMNPYEEITQLFKRADEALYDAKNTGRNKVVTAKRSNDST